MRVCDEHYESASDAVLALLQIEQGGRIFRGHADAKWALIPSATRIELDNLYNVVSENSKFSGIRDQIKSVNNSLKTQRYERMSKFYKLCVERGIPLPEMGQDIHAEMMDFSRPPSSFSFLKANTTCPGPNINLWPLLSLMQHYGIKTELLDWTRNPILALFFASISHPDCDGVVWEFSETVPYNCAAYTNVSWNGFPLFRSPHEGRTDCGIFFERSTYTNNHRIVAQDGILSVSVFNESMCIEDIETDFQTTSDAFDFMKIYTRLNRQLENVDHYASPEGSLARKHVIDSSLKGEILRLLKNIRIDHITVYPELNEISKIIS